MWRDIATTIRIGPRLVGPGEPLFVIAEIGLNHGGSLDRALAMVDARGGGRRVGREAADASRRRRSWRPSCPAPAHVAAPSLREFFARFELDEDGASRRRRARARRTASRSWRRRSRSTAVDLLERVGVDAFKIASGDLTWDQLIDARRATRPAARHLDRHGVARGDRRTRVACARLGGAAGIALLHCVSAYPVPRGSENLRAIATLADAFRVPVGLSDHGDDAFAAADRRRARRLALRAAPRARRRRRGRSTPRCRARPRQLAALVAAAAARGAAALGHGREGLPAGRSAEPDGRAGARSARRGASRAGAMVHRRRRRRAPAGDGLAPGRDRRTGRRRASTARRRRRRAVSRRRPRRPPAKRGVTVKSLNVLITAASRRVPLVQAFRRALSQHGRRLGRRHRRQPAVAGRPRRPIARIACRWRPTRATSTSSSTICAAERIGLVVPTIDDELHAVRRGARRDSPRAASAWRSRRPRRPRSATTSTRPAGRCDARGIAAARVVSARRRCRPSPRSRCSSSRGSAAAASARSRSANAARARLLPRLRRRPRRAGVPRRPRVHDRHALRLRRAGRSRSCRASAS